MKPVQPDAKPDKQAERDLASNIWLLASLTPPSGSGKNA
jgi:hypothetical protein